MTAPLRWTACEPPRQPAAALAVGGAVAGLADAVRASPHQDTLRCAGTPDHLLVLGPAEHLPWSPGVRYLGWAAGILLPTTHTPWPPPELLSDTVRRLGGDDVVVLLPDAILSTPMPLSTVDGAALNGRHP